MFCNDLLSVLRVRVLVPRLHRSSVIKWCTREEEKLVNKQRLIWRHVRWNVSLWVTRLKFGKNNCCLFVFFFFCLWPWSRNIRKMIYESRGAESGALTRSHCGENVSSRPFSCGKCVFNRQPSGCLTFRSLPPSVRSSQCVTRPQSLRRFVSNREGRLGANMKRNFIHVFVLKFCCFRVTSSVHPTMCWMFIILVCKPVEFLYFEKGLWQLCLAPHIFYHCLPTRWLKTNWASMTRPIRSPLRLSLSWNITQQFSSTCPAVAWRRGRCSLPADWRTAPAVVCTSMMCRCNHKAFILTSLITSKVFFSC